MLFGLSVEDALPSNSDVRAFNDVMECLDYSLMESRCSEVGCPPYPPKVMVKVLGYAYSQGVRSSRRIETLLSIDVRFIWLAGGLKPDHNTLARFRKERWEDITGLLEDSARVSAEAGLVFLNTVCTDGSKILAAASRKRVYGQERIKRGMDAVEKILREAEEVDLAEDEQYGSGTDGEIPEHLRDAKERKARLEKIAKQLEDSKKKAVVETEPDSRVMLTSEGKRPAYNMQTSVDADNQIIIAMKLTQSENDHGYLPEMVKEIESNIGLAPDMSIADTGYGDEKTLKWLEETGHDALIPPQEYSEGSRRKGLFAAKCFLHAGDRDVLICPAGRELDFRAEYKKSNGTYRRYAVFGCSDCSFRNECVGKNGHGRRIDVSIMARQKEQMRERLDSEEGRLLYQQRQQTSEPVFGRIKENMGLRRFLLRGIEGATAESALACLAHNVLKCAASLSAMTYLRANKPLTAGLRVVVCVVARFAQWLTHKPARLAIQPRLASYSF
jgi:transposase